MKTRYLVILATLAFVGFSVPASAHNCSRHVETSHKHCAGGGAETTYTVNMMVTSPSTPDAFMCTGTADKRLGPSFGPNACEVELDGVPCLNSGPVVLTVTIYNCRLILHS